MSEKPRFLGFLKTLKVQILGFIFFRKSLKHPDFRLTVTAENCCLSVYLVMLIAML